MVNFTLVNMMLYIVIIVFTLLIRRCCEPLVTTLGSKAPLSGHTFGLKIGPKFEDWFVKPRECIFLGGVCPNSTGKLCHIGGT